MPIEVTYRKAWLGEGLVASFQNNSDRQLAVVVVLANPTLNQQKKFRLDLEAHGSKEIGQMEGWIFASGDTIEISHNDYATLKVAMP